MITKDNLKEVLGLLGFTNKDEIYSKEIGKAVLKVDFKNKKLIYPKNVIIHDKKTCNFAKPENFVVFECVCRLLEKGYKQESIELEPEWNLGREKKGAQADIFVKDKEDKPYLLIECKTAGDEFNTEWGRMQNDGGQLFSYFQQERHTKFLCLYTSDFKNGNIEYENYIINMQDNEKLLKENANLGYKDAHSVIELFRVWRDTYGFEKQENGIFEDEILSYNIQGLKPTYENLKPMTSRDIQKKRHEWATILRANAVGDRTLALNKLMNLFLCKITDELDNKYDLKFSWMGKAVDTPFDLVDRLQKLYKIGMEKYLSQSITYHSKDSIEQAFSENFKDIVIKEKIQNIFNELKYFSNGDFNFIEVYNKALFDENFKILLPIVQSLENIGFTKEVDSNILGDYFESYIHDMPQQEGQYFTPVPLVNFIISSLPVLKDAKVLDFSCGAGHFLTQYAELNKDYEKAYFLGIDKDQRLAKIAKIASFMHQEEMDIYSYDSLTKAQKDDEKHQKAINDNSFNVLISNPPYSVDGFLKTLDEDSRKDYEIFSESLNVDTNNAIECFFIEKAAKALQSNGLLALVLPNSLLNKDGLYQSATELVLRDFYIISIVELGSATFFKTTTSPIILFALRKDRDSSTSTNQNAIFKDFHKLLLENKFENLCEAYDNFLPLLNSYCTFQNYDKEEFKALLKLDLKADSNLFENEIFKEYLSAYNEFVAKEKKTYNDKIEKMKDEKRENFKKENPFTPSQNKVEFIREIECEKFLYFCYSYDSTPLIIKAPKDLKEQKKFLGWEWSNAKGKQGIVYLNATSISELKSILYNPKDRFDENKLNVYILQEYLNKIDNSVLDIDFTVLQDFSHIFKKQIPSILEPYAFRTRLIDMLDFSTSKFNKAISLNCLTSRSEVSKNPFENSQFELVRLNKVCDLNKFKKQVNAEKISTMNLNRGNVKLLPSSKNYDWWTDETTAGEFINEGEVIALGVARYANIKKHKGKFVSANNKLLSIKENIKDVLFDYIYLLLEMYAQTLYKNGSQYPQFDTNKFNDFLIPKPPLPIQKQIVAECEKVEEQYKTIRMSIEEYQRLIKAILVKCGICEDNITGGGAFEFSGIDEFINALLENINNLAKQIDFSLLERLIITNEDKNPNSSLRKSKVSEESTSYSHSERSEESQNPVILSESEKSHLHNNILASPHTKGSVIPQGQYDNTLLASLPTPPPHGWERKKLGEVENIIIKKGKSITQKDTKVGNIKVVAGGLDFAYFHNEANRPKNTITISASGANAGFVNFWEEEIFASDCTTININSITTIKFIFYTLQTMQQNIYSLARGAAQPHVYPDDLKQIQIPIPPLPMQEKIVSVIENIESKIAILSQNLSLLEDTKAEILQKYL